MSSRMSTVSNKLLFNIAVGLGVTMLSGLSYWYYKYWKRNVMPEKWRRVGTLECLYIFPVKSCAAYKVQPDTEVECDILSSRLNGVRDKSLMLVDDNSQMVSARTYPKMILIKIQFLGPAKLLISAPAMKDIEIDLDQLSKESIDNSVHTKIWSSKVDLKPCGTKYDKWFSKYVLDKDNGLRLVYYDYPKPVKAIVSDVSHEPLMTLQDTGTLTDTTSYMLMNLSSVADLNKRLSAPVDPLQFRGNFYLKMDIDEPYAEDNWSWIKIGETVFRNVAPCVRCIMPNIDVVSGERNVDSEPLKTLKSYRKCANYSSPPLGLQLGLRKVGNVKLHDVIYVEDK